MNSERRNLTDFINSPRQLQNQYRDPTNLNARVAIYRFGKPGGTPWTTWVFDRFQFPQNADFLEIGCGGGGLWKGNLHRIDPTWQITLTDLMPGMLEASQQAVGDDPRFNFRWPMRWICRSMMSDLMQWLPITCFITCRIGQRRSGRSRVC